MLRRFISVMVIATAAVLAPVGAAHADPDHGDHPCVITSETRTVASGEPLDVAVECADVTAVDARTGGTTGAHDGGASLVATGPTSLPYLAVAGGLLVLGVTAIVVNRFRIRDN
jgi:hypothetical protein